MISIQALSKTFGGEVVLSDLSVALRRHGTLSILGQSGCGKSTLLKLLAGLEPPDAGRFEVDGEDLFAKAPQARGVVYMSQEPLLFPHLSVRDNLAFGLQIRKTAAADIHSKVAQLAEALGLSDHLDKWPHQLSGGQKQRVNFGRCLIINPRIMLLDEPFGSLDTHTRQDMQQLFKTISHQFGITALFVTHDLKEALIVGDEIAVMQQGRLRLYPSHAAFIAAAESGAQAEIAFWNQFKPSN